MANFFSSPQIPLAPMPEPPGFNLMRAMLMQRLMGQMANPYGLSPGGAGNFQGFNTGNRPFDPYGGGSASPMPSGMGVGMPMGGGMGGVTAPPSGGVMPPVSGPTMGNAPRPAPVGPRMGGGGTSQPPPNIMTLLAALLGGAGGSPTQSQPISRPGAASTGTNLTSSVGFDGTGIAAPGATLGYGGNVMGRFAPPAGPFSGPSLAHRQPPDVLSLMRHLRGLQRPVTMPSPMMGRMR